MDGDGWSKLDDVNTSSSRECTRRRVRTYLSIQRRRVLHCAGLGPRKVAGILNNICRQIKNVRILLNATEWVNHYCRDRFQCLNHLIPV